MENESLIKYSIIKNSKDKILRIYEVCLFSLLFFSLIYFLLLMDFSKINYLIFVIVSFLLNFILLIFYKKLIDKPKINKDLKDELFADLLLVFININSFYYKNSSLLFFNILIIIISVVFCNKNSLKNNFYKVFFINCLYYLIRFITDYFYIELIKGILIISGASLITYIISIYVIDLIVEGLSYMTTINKRQEIFSSNFHKAISDLRIEPMTGLFNKKAMYDTLDVKINNFKDYNKEAHLVIIDLDFFKKVNDTYGHTKGDEVLIALASLLKNKLKNKANAFRYGGEEFVIVFEKQKTEEVYKIMEDIRIAFNKQKFTFLNGGFLSLSGGISKIKKGFNREDWIADADDALYNAKQSGRNKIIIKK